MAPARIPRTIRKLLSSFHGGPFALASLDATDLPAVAAILVKYESLGIQIADASLVYLANRKKIDVMFTLDRRDFGVLRLARGKKPRLVP